MKTSKAIELLNAIVATGEYEGDPDDSAAIKLGLEALKRHQVALTGFTKPELFLLLGETPEERPLPLQKV